MEALEARLSPAFIQRQASETRTRGKGQTQQSEELAT